MTRGFRRAEQELFKLLSWAQETRNEVARAALLQVDIAPIATRGTRAH